MKTQKPEPKKQKRPANQINGVQLRAPYFIPGRGTVEAESIEEAIKTPANESEEVKNGND